MSDLLDETIEALRPFAEEADKCEEMHNQVGITGPVKEHSCTMMNYSTLVKARDVLNNLEEARRVSRGGFG